jgi:anti-sigma28 factor (negative regulator of flagellin synthesis)
MFEPPKPFDKHSKDIVTISDEATRLLNILKNMNSNDDEREKRILELKKSLQNGNYDMTGNVFYETIIKSLSPIVYWRKS